MNDLAMSDSNKSIGNDTSIIIQQQSQDREKKQRRKILPEEQYTSTLKKIITRDYYPSLPSLHRDAAVLQKRSEGDTAGAIAIRRAARKIESYEEKCRIQEENEEREAILENGGLRKRPRPLERESIDGFHSRVTSEDNAYFEENMVKEVKENRDKMDIIYQANCSAGKGHVPPLLQSYAENGTETRNDQRRLCSASPFQSASDQFNAPVERIHVAGTTKDGKSISDRNSLFFTPQHYSASAPPPSALESTASYNCQTIVPSSNSTTAKEYLDDTQIMPPPPSRQKKTVSNDEKAITIKSHTSPIEPNNHHLVEYQAKSTNREMLSLSSTSEKQIIPKNTRFHYQNESRIVARSTPSTVTTIPSTRQNIESYETDSSLNTDLDAPLRPLQVERQARLNQLQKERNTLVQMTPSIVPGSKRKYIDNNGDGNDEDDNDSPLITWGEIASTPLVSSGETLSQINPGMNYTINDNENANDQNEKSFVLPSVDSREKNARKAEASVARQKKRFEEAGDKRQQKRDKDVSVSDSTLRMSSASNFLARKQSLTPAARSLLERSTTAHSSLSIKSSFKVDARSNSALGSVLRASYTPKRKKTPGSTRVKNKDRSLLHKSTPLSSRKSKCDPGNSEQQQKKKGGHLDGSNGNVQSLTSGLLRF